MGIQRGCRSGVVSARSILFVDGNDGAVAEARVAPEFDADRLRADIVLCHGKGDGKRGNQEVSPQGKGARQRRGWAGLVFDEAEGKDGAIASDGSGGQCDLVYPREVAGIFESSVVRSRTRSSNSSCARRRASSALLPSVSSL